MKGARQTHVSHRDRLAGHNGERFRCAVDALLIGFGYPEGTACSTAPMTDSAFEGDVNSGDCADTQ